MISAQGLLDRIQKNVGVPWQSQRSDGFSDGILFGKSEATATGIVTTYTSSLQVLKRAVDSGRNSIIRREAPFYSRGERAPLFWRNGPAPAKQLTDNDAVCTVKRGEKKALIQLPHEAGEEAGMEECARWLRTSVSEVPIKFIASGDPFWIPA